MLGFYVTYDLRYIVEMFSDLPLTLGTRHRYSYYKQEIALFTLYLPSDPTLPGDRTSQITRRGMLAGRIRTNVNSKTKKSILKTTTKLLKQHHEGKG